MMMPPKRVSLVSRGDDATALLGILGPACMPLLATGRLSATTTMSALGRKQTCAAHKLMSAECQKRTSPIALITSSAREKMPQHPEDAHFNNMSTFATLMTPSAGCNESCNIPV